MIKHALLYLQRGKSRSFLLFLILFIMCFFMLTGFMLVSEANQAADDIRKSIGASFYCSIFDDEEDDYGEETTKDFVDVVFDYIEVASEVGGKILGVPGKILGGVAGAVQMTVGASVNLGKTNWTRAANWHNPSDVDALAAAAASAAALTAANAALADEKANLEQANAQLTQANADLQKALQEAEANSGLTEVEPAAFYFEIGQTTLSAKELAHLDFYLSNVLPYVKGKTVTVITGNADKKTGSSRRNKYLSEKRAQYLQNLLSEKYGIDASSFEVRTNIVTEGDAALGRSVVISFE